MLLFWFESAQMSTVPRWQRERWTKPQWQEKLQTAALLVDKWQWPFYKVTNCSLTALHPKIIFPTSSPTLWHCHGKAKMLLLSHSPPKGLSHYNSSQNPVPDSALTLLGTNYTNSNTKYIIAYQIHQCKYQIYNLKYQIHYLKCQIHYLKDQISF